MWLEDDPDEAGYPEIDANTAHNASIMIEVTGKDGDDVIFTLTSHEYNAATGDYEKAELVIRRDVSDAANLFAGDAAGRTIGNIVFEDDTGELAVGPDNYTVGDKIIFNVNAEAIDADSDYVQIGYDSPATVNDYDVNTAWVFGNNVLNDEVTVLRFFTMDARGNVYDGFTTLGIDEIGDSVVPHSTFTFLPEDDSTYAYTSYAFDSLGNQHFLDVIFQKTYTNTWEYTITHQDQNITLNGGTGTLRFDPSGRLLPIASDIPPLDFDPDNGADRVDVEMDFGIITQLVMESNVIARGQDGYAAGELVAFDVQKTGIVSGTYTNGMIKTLGQVAMATFINPEGLLTLGANLFDASANSGDPRIGLPGDQGRGMIQARSLEMSNVDLANEFTEMITTNRAFQANSRVISTSDEVLHELVNLKR